MKRVVITGAGVMAPNGIGLKEFWANTKKGVSGVRPITQFDLDGCNAKIAGQIEGKFCDPWGSSTDPRYLRFARYVANEAIESAKLDPQLIGTRTGVSIATAIGATAEMEREFLRSTNQGAGEFDWSLLGSQIWQDSTFDTASNSIAHHFGATGPTFCVSTGCTAGLDTIGHSLELIREGRVDLMIAGASEAPISPIAMAAFDVIGALTTASNDDPASASRPFDKDRSGFVLAEAAGCIVLESLDHALSREAPILAEVNGFSSTSNAMHMTDIPHEAKQLSRSMKEALKLSALKPSDIDYVSAHGSSTPQNDRAETKAIRSIFGDRGNTLPISSLKSMIGHPLAASNLVELIASIMTINTGVVHPTINYQVKDPECDLFYVPNQSINMNVDRVLKTASGFSGIHSSLVISRYKEGII